MALLDWPRGRARAGLEPGPLWRGRTRPGQLGSGRCGLTMTPGSGRPGTTRGEGGARPAHHPRPARPPARGPRPAVTCLRRCSVQGPGLPRPAAPPPLPRRNPGSGDERGTRRCAGRGGRRAGRRTMRPALNCAARVGPDGAWPSVYVCACQSTLTNATGGRTPPHAAPLPPPLGGF